MDEVREKKQEIRNEISTFFNSLSKEVLERNTRIIEERLFEFANFLESKIVMLYVNSENEVSTANILRRAYGFNKIVVLPAFAKGRSTMTPMKVDNPEKDLITGPRGILATGPGPMQGRAAGLYRHRYRTGRGHGRKGRAHRIR